MQTAIRERWESEFRPEDEGRKDRGSGESRVCRSILPPATKATLSQYFARASLVSESQDSCDDGDAEKRFPPNNGCAWAHQHPFLPIPLNMLYIEQRC